MIMLRMRRFREDDLCDGFNLFEMRVAGLMDDISKRNENGERREYCFVYVERTLGTAENENGWNVFFQTEILFGAFSFYAGKRLTDRNAGACNFRLHIFRKIVLRAFKRKGD